MLKGSTQRVHFRAVLADVTAAIESQKWSPHQGTADAEIKVPFLQRPHNYRLRAVSLKPGVSQDIAFHASSTARSMMHPLFFQLCFPHILLKQKQHACYAHGELYSLWLRMKILGWRSVKYQELVSLTWRGLRMTHWAWSRSSLMVHCFRYLIELVFLSFGLLLVVLFFVVVFLFVVFKHHRIN